MYSFAELVIITNSLNRNAIESGRMFPIELLGLIKNARKSKKYGIDCESQQLRSTFLDCPQTDRMD